MSKSFIEIRLIGKRKKTSVYEVTNKKSGDVLGVIYWHNGWRCYVFEPKEETIWSSGCLNELELFLERLKGCEKMTMLIVCKQCRNQIYINTGTNVPKYCGSCGGKL